MDSTDRVAETRVTNGEDVKAIILKMPLELQERLVNEIVELLPEESKRRVKGLDVMTLMTNDSSLSTTAQICALIHDFPNLDLAVILEAVVQRRKRDRMEEF